MKDGNLQTTYPLDPNGNSLKLIDINTAGHHPVSRFLWSLLQRPIEKALALDSLNHCYAQFYQKAVSCNDAKEIFRLGLESLDVTYSISTSDLQKIPEKGPLVVVANHPFGGLEGVILGAIMLQVRPDLKILGNYLLKRIVGIRDRIIAVDPFESKPTVSNLKGLKEAIQWVKSGSALIIFPAGEVSSFHPGQGRVVDPSWATHIGGIIRRTKAATLPVYFPGKNGSFFQLLGLFHPRLRTAMLPRELVNKSGKEIKVYVGKAIPWRKLHRFESDQKIVNYLRISTYFLKNRTFHNKRSLRSLTNHRSGQPARDPVFEAVLPSLLKNDIAALPAEQRLVQKGHLIVYIARSSQIPNLLNEIGRQRELSFREVQEGTGKSVDLDRFDSYYLHLFLWNQKKEELIGAYRLGLVDEILRAYGPRGLYTSTLFRFKPEFVNRLVNAIEMGRSFIRSEYQKKFNSLMLLWRGIGEFIGQNPHYKILFGPVSISQDYHTVSKNLIIRFLKINNLDPQLSRFVSPRNSYRSGRVEGVSSTIIKSSFQDIDDISLLISEIENDGKGVPILLRHYLKLNGSLISFNADKAFSSVVDGLLLVDLTKTDPKLLRRLIGEKSFENFLRYQQIFHEPHKIPDYAYKH
jgi:putative hemolysin